MTSTEPQINYDTLDWDNHINKWIDNIPYVWIKLPDVTSNYSGNESWKNYLRIYLIDYENIKFLYPGNYDEATPYKPLSFLEFTKDRDIKQQYSMYTNYFLCIRADVNMIELINSFSFETVRPIFNFRICGFKFNNYSVDIDKYNNKYESFFTTIIYTTGLSGIKKPKDENILNWYLNIIEREKFTEQHQNEFDELIHRTDSIFNEEDIDYTKGEKIPLSFEPRANYIHEKYIEQTKKFAMLWFYENLKINTSFRILTPMNFDSLSTMGITFVDVRDINSGSIYLTKHLIMLLVMGMTSNFVNYIIITFQLNEKHNKSTNHYYLVYFDKTIKTMYLIDTHGYNIVLPRRLLDLFLQELFVYKFFNEIFRDWYKETNYNFEFRDNEIDMSNLYDFCFFQNIWFIKQVFSSHSENLQNNSKYLDVVKDLKTVHKELLDMYSNSSKFKFKEDIIKFVKSIEEYGFNIVRDKKLSSYYDAFNEDDYKKLTYMKYVSYNHELDIISEKILSNSVSPIAYRGLFTNFFRDKKLISEESGNIYFYIIAITSNLKELKYVYEIISDAHLLNNYHETFTNDGKSKMTMLFDEFRWCIFRKCFPEAVLSKI